MAANVVTVLKQIIESNSMPQEQIVHGLSYAKWGDCMGEEWHLLYYSPDFETSKEIAKAILPKYERMMEILGNPLDAYEWYSRMWGGWLKTRKKHEFFKVYHANPAGNMYENPFWKMDYDARIGVKK